MRDQGATEPCGNECENGAVIVSPSRAGMDHIWLHVSCRGARPPCEELWADRGLKEGKRPDK